MSRWMRLALGLVLIALGAGGLSFAPWQPVAPFGTAPGPWMMGRAPYGMMRGWSGPWGTPPGGASPGGSSAQPNKEIPQGATVVELRQVRFVPTEITVAPGTTVVFVNRDPYPHDIVQASPADLGKKPAGFTSPWLQPGQQWSYTFTAAGTYPILCDVAGHYLAGMVGRVTVQ